MRVLSYHISTQTLLIVFIDMLLACVAATSARIIVSFPEDGFAYLFSPQAPLAAAGYALLITIGMGSMGLYDSRQRYDIEGALVRMFLGVCVGTIGLAVFGFMLGISESPIVRLLAFAETLVLLGVARVVFNRVWDDEKFRRRVVVYGAGERASKILQLRRRSDQRGFRVVAFLAAPGDSGCIEDERVIGCHDCSVLDFVQENAIDEIVVASDDRRKSFPVAELLECKLRGYRVTDLLEFLERESGRVKVDIMNPSWLIFSESFNRRNRNRLRFRVVDLACAGLLSVLALPVMLLVAAGILVRDGRPVLYRQTRVGLNRSEFTLYKFRSMHNDAEADGAAVWASAGDPRVTPLGYWLRKFRLDELPQLINVLRGDMSMVGPRPERPEFVAELATTIPYYHERHYIKPGITGWAQLCYPYGASEKDALAKLEFDLYYIKNRSLVFYLLILLQTAEVVLWRKGSR